MLVKGIVDEDFINYKLPSMFIGCHSCSFKCDWLNGTQVCQNGTLASAPDIEISVEELVERYIKNDITNAVVFGGLEPFDDIDNVMLFIDLLRNKKNNHDDIVIYTGYTEDEIRINRKNYYLLLKEYGNIIIKFGRFISNQKKHFDDILGVYLSSSNQYAKRI